MNDYCKKAVDYVKKNYTNIINRFDYDSISIGGSIARGYGNELSDIDLICLGKKFNKYKKNFIKIDSYNIEIHEIPFNYLEGIIKQLSEYIVFTNLDKDIIKKININKKSFGAKKCNMIEKNDNELTKFLSDWRELKKITDSIIIYESNTKLLTSVKKSLNRISLKKSFFNLIKLNEEFNNTDKIINLLKINSFINNDVFSKVLWVDLYLKKSYNLKIEKIISNKILLFMRKNTSFYNWYNSNLIYIYQLHKKHECSICKGDMMQCNIMRCINDYYNDTQKAKDKKYIFGEYFSIQRVLTYIKLLYDKSNFTNLELNKLIREFDFNDDEYIAIRNIVRRKIDDKSRNKKEVKT